MQIECASRTHVGLKRKINEDSILVQPERGLFVVADGMGGHDAGEVASAMAVEALGRLGPSEDLGTFASDAVDALCEVNGALIDLARSNGSDRSIGTTVVGVAISGDAFRCFWAGDSRAYRLRNGELSRISRDHSLVQQLVDSGILKPEEAELQDNANVITRAVGVAPELEVELVEDGASAGDLFLLASDGLTRVVSDDELRTELDGSGLDEAADTLLNLVLARGAPDNVSMIIVRLL